MGFDKFLDKAMSTAEKSVGTASKVKDNVDKFKTTFAQLNASKQPTGIGGIPIGGTGNIGSQLTGLGLGSTATSLASLKKIVKNVHMTNKDAREQLTNLKNMFGLDRSELFEMASSKPREILASKLSDAIVQVEDIISVPADLVNGLPNPADYIDGKFPDLYSGMPAVQSIEEATAYLQDQAGSFMGQVQDSLPAIGLQAQEGLQQMTANFQAMAASQLGGLSETASGILSSVEIPFEIPDIASIQAMASMNTVMANIQNIQACQFGMDCMDKALEMTPEIQAAIDAFNNFEWEGVGETLGAIVGFEADIVNTDIMTGIITDALAGSPPIQMATKKIQGVMNQANSIAKTVASKKAAAESAIDTISSLFS